MAQSAPPEAAEKALKDNQKKPSHNVRPQPLTPAFMRAWPLPEPDPSGDKESRGRVLVIGGAPEMPGAAILAATAALRAGAGKLRIATCGSIAPVIGAAVPEARVFALPETKAGGIAPRAADRLAAYANETQSVLIGPGMVDEKAIVRLLIELLPQVDGPAVVLDAGALSCLAENGESLHGLNRRVVITPHAGEMAKLTGLEKKRIEREPVRAALEAARRLRTVIALKGAETYIVAPVGERVYQNRAGNVGLATSGSGDTLSGIIAGLAARGAPPMQAAAWGVYLHGRAGDRLARRMGQLGFLSRELLAEIPALMAELSRQKKS